MRACRFAVAVVGWAALTVVAGPPGHAGDGPPAPVRVKRLIEFGWDEPDTTFLRQHIAEMERTPFDGCVFHVDAIGPKSARASFTWLCWGKRAFTEAELQPALDDLKATKLRRFTHNFLRFNTTPADLDWFDDFSAVVQNARLAGRIAREGKCAGILLDDEEYQAHLFTYSRQRDAKTKTWDAYAAQVHRRGRELMTAFQEGFPSLTILLTFGQSLPLTDADEGKAVLRSRRYGLLVPFLDGMQEAAQGGARLVDGYELAYGFRTEAQFENARRFIKEGVLANVANAAKYRDVVSAGFGLWIDYDWREHGWRADDPAKNYFTPETFETSLRHALAESDEFVWIYSETPRWWSPEGGRVKLPAAYDSAIRRARMGQSADLP